MPLRILRRLRSLRLAAFLIAYLALGSIAATLVPQGQTAAFYRGRYTAPMGFFLTVSGLTRFFSSPAFLAPALLFFTNLTACTATRFLRELRKKEGRHFGSPILHVGLMILALGAGLSASTRREGLAYLAAGDRAAFSGPWSIELLDFTFEKYPDGRPKDWLSTVNIYKGEAVFSAAYPLRVNHPVRAGGMSLYQASWRAETLLELLDGAGIRRTLRQGQSVSGEGWELTLLPSETAEGPAPVHFRSPYSDGILTVSGGDVLGPVIVASVSRRMLSGIEVVEDRGYPLVLSGLALAGAGIAAVCFRKAGSIR